MSGWWQDAVVYLCVVGAGVALIALRRAQRKRDHGCGAQCDCPKPVRGPTRR
jgi:hypothetical protein